MNIQSENNKRNYQGRSFVEIIRENRIRYDERQKIFAEQAKRTAFWNAKSLEEIYEEILWLIKERLRIERDRRYTKNRDALIADIETEIRVRLPELFWKDLERVGPCLLNRNIEVSISSDIRRLLNQLSN